MKDLLPKLVIGFMVATTAATSAFAGMKLVEAPRPPIIATSNSPKDNSIKSQIESKFESLGEMFQMPSFIHNENQKPQPAVASSASSASSSSARSFVLASSSSSSRLSSSAATNNSNDCVITLFGKQYKINSLLNSHSGGNIFNCGTDMTSTYQGKHGTNVSRMTQYIVANATSTSSSSSLTSSSTSSSSSSSTNPNDCIITLFGQQYKINSLLNSHSGGNIFNCGTDMTSVYQGRHGTSLSRMAKYAITSGGSTSGSGASSSSSGGSKHDDDDDDEGEREEDRYED